MTLFLLAALTPGMSNLDQCAKALAVVDGYLTAAFVNANLSAAMAFTVDDSSFAFNWQSASPALTKLGFKNYSGVSSLDDFFGTVLPPVEFGLGPQPSALPTSVLNPEVGNRALQTLAARCGVASAPDVVVKLWTEQSTVRRTGGVIDDAINVAVYTMNTAGNKIQTVDVYAQTLKYVQAFSLPAPAGQLAGTLSWNYNIPESIEYDASNHRLVVGSIGSGRVIGIPMPLAGGRVLDSADVHVYFEGGVKGASNSAFATAGVQVDPVDPCLLYAAVGGFPAYKGPGTEIGVATINLCSGDPSAPAYFTDLTSLAKPSGSMCNDIAAPTWGDGDLYVTDFAGSQLIRIRGQNTASPSYEVVMASCPGCNGIEWLADGTLLVSQLNGAATGGAPPLGLYRLNPATGVGALVSGTAAFAGDGIIFDAKRETLYSVVNGIDVVAVQSFDGWQSAVQVGSVDANCGDGGPATAAVLVNQTYMYINCAAGFGAGPFPITSLTKYAAQMAIPASKLHGHYIVYGVNGGAPPPSECEGFKDGDAVPPSCCYGPQAPAPYELFGDFAEADSYCSVVHDPAVNFTWGPYAYCDANGVGYVKEYCTACGACGITSAMGPPSPTSCYKALDFADNGWPSDTRRFYVAMNGCSPSQPAAEATSCGDHASVAPITAAVGWILFALSVLVILVLVCTNEQFKRSQQLGSQGQMLMSTLPTVGTESSGGLSGIDVKPVVNRA